MRESREPEMTLPAQFYRIDKSQDPDMTLPTPQFLRIDESQEPDMVHFADTMPKVRRVARTWNYFAYTIPKDRRVSRT